MQMLVMSASKDKDKDRALTSSTRSASALFFKNSLMFPLSIHSDTMTNRRSIIVTPNRGSTFGWRRVLHIITSLQNSCVGRGMRTDEHKKCRGTHFSYSIKVIRFAHPQTLGCNLPAEVFTLPHVRKSTTTTWCIRWFVTKWNLQRCRKQGLTATNPVGSAKTPHADLSGETAQHD